MKSFLSILRKYPLAMVMNFVGLALAFTAFLVLMVQVGYERGFDRNHPTSGRIFRVDKTGTGKDDIFRNILPRGYADDIISCSPHIEAGQVLLDLQYSRRTIAIRKVYGAESAPLILDCLKNYTFKLLVSYLIAAPIGWFAIVKWQESFVEKVGVCGLEFVVAFAGIGILTLAVVALMSWKAAQANPVESLRKE